MQQEQDNYLGLLLLSNLFTFVTLALTNKPRRLHRKHTTLFTQLIYFFHCI